MTTTYSQSELKVGEDWRYSKSKMKLRAEALTILIKHFGEGPYDEYPNRSIYECANEWCSKQDTTSGLVKYYQAYYESRQT